MISLMTYVSAERAGHATESRKITLPTLRTLPTLARSVFSRAYHLLREQ